MRVSPLVVVVVIEDFPVCRYLLSAAVVVATAVHRNKRQL